MSSLPVFFITLFNSIPMVERFSSNKLLGTIFLLRGILILLGLFFVGLFVTQLVSALFVDSENISRSQMLLTSVIQNIFAFILPALVFNKIIYGNYTKQDGLRNGSHLSAYIVPVILIIIAMPFMNYIVEWNQNLSFPASMQGFEHKLREMEDLNASFSAKILDTSSFWGLITGVICIGILTGFGEEIFFRGALQKLFVECGINHHIAIWTAAFVFSAIHFQFFGFVPRLLIGAGLGYLFYWTGSIWVSASAHAVNNSMVVIFTWLQKNRFLTDDLNTVGVTASGFPVEATVSLICFCLTLYFSKKAYLFNSEKV